MIDVLKHPAPVGLILAGTAAVLFGVARWVRLVDDAHADLGGDEDRIS